MNIKTIKKVMTPHKKGGYKLENDKKNKINLSK